MNNGLTFNHEVALEVKKFLEDIDNIIVKFDLFGALVEKQL